MFLTYLYLLVIVDLHEINDQILGRIFFIIRGGKKFCVTGKKENILIY